MRRFTTNMALRTILSASLLPVLLLAGLPALGDDSTEPADQPTDPADEQPQVEQGDGIDSPKTMSGMSILGNEEAPKSLVIIPWKSSELGDDISLTDTLDDRAKPVDKEVFLRELRFYEIRSGD